MLLRFFMCKKYFRKFVNFFFNYEEFHGYISFSDIKTVKENPGEIFFRKMQIYRRFRGTKKRLGILDKTTKRFLLNSSSF